MLLEKKIFFIIFRKYKNHVVVEQKYHKFPPPYKQTGGSGEDAVIMSASACKSPENSWIVDTEKKAI